MFFIHNLTYTMDSRQQIFDFIPLKKTLSSSSQLSERLAMAMVFAGKFELETKWSSLRCSLALLTAEVSFFIAFGAICFVYHY